MVSYFKRYHDNVRKAVRSIEIYSEDFLDREINQIVNEIIDTRTDHNGNEHIKKLLELQKEIDEKYDELPYYVVDDLNDKISSGIFQILFDKLQEDGKISAGDYDLIMEVDGNEGND